MRYLILSMLFLAASPAIAEPPPGHPSIEEAQKALEVSPDEPLVHKGQVLQTIASNDYVYIEVSTEEGGKRWLAAPLTDVGNQAWIRYSDGSVMRDFYSRKHDRTFDEVMFVDRVAILGN